MIEKKLLNVGAGLIIGAVGGKILNSRLAKKAGVNIVKQGLRVKESIDNAVESAKLSAEDIVAEAKEIKKAEDKAEAEKKANIDIENVACDIEKSQDEVKEEVEE